MKGGDIYGVIDIKYSQLKKVAEHREQLRSSPQLKWLFFEITRRCNLHCLHCGSSCDNKGASLSLDDIDNVLESITGDKPMVCLTGGEPLLHPDFFEIAQCITEKSFCWGITTNATLIDKEVASRLKDVGMSTISVSLDGLEHSHDALRQKRGAWELALSGIKHLQDAGFNPMITTVVYRDNIAILEKLYMFLCGIGIKSWRLVNMEPIGRANKFDELMLDYNQFKYLLTFIREKRFDRSCPMEVSFGCSHYLGVEDERMVRDHYFMCGAGIIVASVRSNGDITACLDIENRPELVQGNIRINNFMDIWLNRFHEFRHDRTTYSKICKNCPDRFLCGGDSTHTWDFEKKEPKMCYLKMKNNNY